MRDVRGNGVDHGVGLLSHFESLVPCYAALVVIAVRHNDDRATELVARLVLGKLVAGREEDRILVHHIGEEFSVS